VKQFINLAIAFLVIGECLILFLARRRDEDDKDAGVKL